MRAATPELNGVQWHKSSYSGGEQGSECVEVGKGLPEAVPVRDSKDPTGPVLTFAPAAWADFVVAVREGAFPAS
ncbi:DUF397 domain-containing protein [Actinacidiphila acidipaludis]|uniref:DUF397 domain-containing protein n=1 Tax=Actinacidiphila acidipaludis TaxID=2873382 RepID=A0ABS7Q846_9ACTN|nr:DUF397 domain-containing protein [Streptomyces acidipaludis]MBY8879312.1 DUF397 domain-containing protein [Streptomyces acidipaludis]